MQVLLSHGANVNIADNDGISPLLAFIESTDCGGVPMDFGRVCPKEADSNQAQEGSIWADVGQSMHTEQSPVKAGQQEHLDTTTCNWVPNTLQVELQTTCTLHPYPPPPPPSRAPHPSMVMHVSPRAVCCLVLATVTS